MVRQMQLKTTITYHFTLVRMTTVKKSTNNKCWRRCKEKVTLLHNWWECKLVPPWKTEGTFIIKLKIELLSNLAIPLLGGYPEKTIIRKETCTLMFIATVFKIAKTWKQPKCPSIGEWIKEKYCKDINIVEYFSAIKRMKPCHLKQYKCT